MQLSTFSSKTKKRKERAAHVQTSASNPRIRSISPWQIKSDPLSLGEKRGRPGPFHYRETDKKRAFGGQDRSQEG